AGGSRGGARAGGVASRRSGTRRAHARRHGRGAPARARAVAGRNLQTRGLPLQPAPAHGPVRKPEGSLNMQPITALVADPICREHLRVRQHPERPERFDAVMDALSSAGVRDRCLLLESRSATEDELALCPTREYVAIARRDVETGQDY